MGANYRCKACSGIVPRGHRMKHCGCGKVMVDWGAGGKSSTIRVIWPGGSPDDWIETIVDPISPVLQKAIDETKADIKRAFEPRAVDYLDARNDPVGPTSGPAVLGKSRRLKRNAKS